jgi:hypothetical protein
MEVKHPDLFIIQPTCLCTIDDTERIQKYKEMLLLEKLYMVVNDLTDLELP